MAEVVLFHHAQGLRRDVREWAEALGAAGHTVHTPDLFEGATFERLDDGMAHRDEIGIPELMRRAAAALEELPAELVYAGFSMGSATAEFYAATRPGARAALLMSGVAPLAAFGVTNWPAGVPAQVHYAEGDSLMSPEELGPLRELGAQVEVFTYPGGGHLIADPDGPDYDPASARLMLERAGRFLAGLGWTSVR
jgi:dienelactone hydrolase